MSLREHAAEQHAPHRPVAARAAHEQVDLALVQRRELVDDVALEQLLGRLDARRAATPSASSSAARTSSRTVARNASSASRPMTGENTSARGATTV